MLSIREVAITMLKWPPGAPYSVLKVRLEQNVFLQGLLDIAFSTYAELNCGEVRCGNLKMALRAERVTHKKELSEVNMPHILHLNS